MLRCVAADILVATTVVLQGASSRTDAKSRAERSIDLECRATLPRREETRIFSGVYSAFYDLVVLLGSELRSGVLSALMCFPAVR